MTAEQIENYLNLQILKPMILDTGEYRLRRPLRMTITKAVLNNLDRIYVKNREKGGIFDFKPNGNGSLLCSRFIEVPNMANTTYNFLPNEAFFNAAVNEVLTSGGLPIVVHTHPTELGFDKYDSRRVQFYLKSSKPDRQLARNGIVPFLNMPEAIFVKDERLNGGFGLNFFTGGIFPQSITSLTSLQFGAVGVGALAFGKNKAITALAAMAFGFEFWRKPNYYLLSDGSLEVRLSV